MYLYPRHWMGKMRLLILSIISTLALLIHPLSLSTQNSFSLSLDVDGSAGDQAATYLNMSADRIVAIQIFGKDMQSANGLAVRFEYNTSQVTYEGFDAGVLLPQAHIFTEQGTNPTFVKIGIGSLGGQVSVSSGLVGTIRFRSTVAFSGTAIRLVRAELRRGGQFETVALNIRVALRVSAAPYPDFDGNGMVDVADFLLFVGAFGASRGDRTYQSKYDLDGNGAIGVSDFLIFVNDFGKSVPPPVRGGSPDLIVDSPSVSDSTLTVGQSFTLRATVHNQGDGQSAPTTLHYYHSLNSIISTNNKEVGTSSVSGLSASGISTNSIRLNAPSNAGTYYYGACVDNVNGESDTGNNCSTGVRITVTVVDDHGDTLSGATQVSVGSMTSGRLSEGDTDYFRVSMSGSGTLSAYTTGSTDTYGSILNSSGDVLVENDDAGVDRNFWISALVSSDTYYIRIRGYDYSTTGNYTLRIGTRGNFNIELVFVDNSFTSSQKAIFQQVAGRWMSIITEDIRDIDFSVNPYNAWDVYLGRIRVNDTVDDLRIFVRAIVIDGFGDTLGKAGPFFIREDTKLPALGMILLDRFDLRRMEDDELWTVIFHEMGHALGFGTLWEDLGLIRGSYNQYFTGPLSIQAFDNAGGRNYNGAKVPIERDGGHWRESVFGAELMTSRYNSNVANSLSAVTIQSLADLGYRADVSQADTYSLPFPLSTKIVVSQSSDWGDCILKRPIYVSDENGRITHVIEK